MEHSKLCFYSTSVVCGMNILEDLDMRMRLCCWSIEREWHVSGKALARIAEDD